VQSVSWVSGDPRRRWPRFAALRSRRSGGTSRRSSRLARILRDDATADRELREAHRLYTEMGATGHAERIAAELGE
jgi:hypothetical protein